MNYRIHMAGALASAYLVISGNNSYQVGMTPMIFIAGAILGGLVPDIDTPDSLIGGMLEPISNCIKDSIGHRTFFHSILFVIIACAIGIMFSESFGVGLAIGIISHIILDLLDRKGHGVAFLYPFIKGRLVLFNRKKYK